MNTSVFGKNLFDFALRMAMVLLPLTAWGAASGQMETSRGTSPPREGSSIARLVLQGEVNLAALQRFSYIGSKILAQDAGTRVYQGLRDPIFQVVLTGPSEKPTRVLIEYDLKKQNLALVNAFQDDWTRQFKGTPEQVADWSALASESAAHLRAYCDKLPVHSACVLRVWQVKGRGQVVRVDLRLPMGPLVPKAIEWTP